ncbi:DUF805 domain-containing protein [Bacillus pseudomycoides]|uniref:DUF805 domain-containing protein n=1 Tax=Bacillus pseudomycoides TaxID=64104 RepID=UPI001FB42FE2|nr:DUF805 domain-containing protein [Bacillus pseudomycoides]
MLRKIADIFYILFGLYTLAILLSALAVSMRRLHDTGRSGWWQLISLIPIIGGMVQTPRLTKAINIYSYYVSTYQIELFVYSHI